MTAPLDHAATVEAYVVHLRDHHPEDIRRACTAWARRQKFWPALSELLAAVEWQRKRRLDRETERALPPPLADWWDAPWQRLGLGLQLARGGYLLREATAQEARERFNRVVGALGLDRAKLIADTAYTVGMGGEIPMRALEHALAGDDAPPAPVGRAA